MQILEAMPTTMAGFKDHSLYALQRHLKQNEVIHPMTELGKFRGEPVYARTNVHELKTAENWMRRGRVIRTGCQAMKWVKQRASTVTRRREIEAALERGREDALKQGIDKPVSELLQGLYSEAQTDIYRPPPVLDVSGIVFCCDCLTKLSYSAGYYTNQQFRKHKFVCCNDVTRRCFSSAMYVLYHPYG